MALYFYRNNFIGILLCRVMTAVVESEPPLSRLCYKSGLSWMVPVCFIEI